MLAEKSAKRAKNDVMHKATDLSKYGSIPAIAQQKDLLEQIIHNSFLERGSIPDYEDVRQKLRDLIKFIPELERVHYDTDFSDDILSTEWNESSLDNDDLINYRKKVNYYILQHQQTAPKPALQRPCATDRVYADIQNNKVKPKITGVLTREERRYRADILLKIFGLKLKKAAPDWHRLTKMCSNAILISSLDGIY